MRSRAQRARFRAHDARRHRRAAAEATRTNICRRKAKRKEKERPAAESTMTTCSLTVQIGHGVSWAEGAALNAEVLEAGRGD